MNERIRQLAKKSGFSLDTNNIYTAKLEHLPITENMEKFAELIVRECCDVLQNEDIRHSGYGYNQGFLHKKIKEHFGVEE
jgi:hypothetical protein